MEGLGKGLAVGLTAIGASIAVCVLRTPESVIMMGAPCVVAFFIYVLGNC